jgi:CheY-like chemotaxis protein
MNTEPRPISTVRGPDHFPVPLRLKVLVVDDNKEAAASTAELLEVCGAKTQACYRGQAALAALEWFEPDACVLDLSMPGMDGFELAAAIRARDARTLLVALTALNDARTLQRAEAAGFEVHFTKPVDPAQLLRTLGERVRRAGGESQPVPPPADATPDP